MLFTNRKKKKIISFFFSPISECTGCAKEIVEGQALIALDSQWHVWCFKCVTCNTLLHGEYMGKYVDYLSSSATWLPPVSL